ncbi:hypothetical protein [Moraxella lacunata]|nr:hypothetical protein [Moraxella lacunata]
MTVQIRQINNLPQLQNKQHNQHKACDGQLGIHRHGNDIAKSVV